MGRAPPLPGGGDSLPRRGAPDRTQQARWIRSGVLAPTSQSRGWLEFSNFNINAHRYSKYSTSIFSLSTHYQGCSVSEDPYIVFQWRSLQIVGVPFLNNVNINVYNVGRRCGNWRSLAMTMMDLAKMTDDAGGRTLHQQ